MSTTAEETEAREVLSAAQPLSRDSLKDREIVTALWKRAEELGAVGHNLHGTFEVVRNVEKEGNIFLSDVGAALDYHGIASVPSDFVSHDMSDRLGG